jgi:hypothetical protein
VRSSPTSLGLVLVTLLVTACGGNGASPVPSNPSGPASSTATLSGRVFDASAGSAVPVAGAAIAIWRGAEAGPKATSAADGSYRLDGIAIGSFDVQVTRAGYADRTEHVSLTASASRDFLITPIVRETLTGEVSAASPVCQAGSLSAQPCQRFPVTVQVDGRLNASMTYTTVPGSENALTLLLCKDPCGTGDVLDTASSSYGGSWDVFGDVKAGEKYWLQVRYGRGTTPQAFELGIWRPR